MKASLKTILSVYIIVNCSPTWAANSCEELLAQITPMVDVDSMPPASSPSGISARVVNFLSAKVPEYNEVKDALKSLEKMDTSRPEVQKNFGSFKTWLNTVAKTLLTNNFQKDASEEALQSISNKFRLLNTPALRNFLDADLQAKVGQGAWSFNRTLWSQTLSRIQKIETLNQRMKAIWSQKAVAVLPASKISSSVLVNVVQGDIMQTQAEGIIATIGCNGYCSSALHSQLNTALGKVLNGRKLMDGESLTVRPDPKEKGSDKQYVLVADDQNLPLHQIVLKALVEAEKSGLRSVALPAIRTADGFGSVERSMDHVVSELIKGIALFSTETKGLLKGIDFNILNNAGLAEKIQKEINQARQPRERSVRDDIREAKLSGEGYTLVPSKVRPKVDTKRSPIYKTMLQPWDLSHMTEAHPPLRIGTIVDQKAFSAPVVSVLNMPIKMPGTGFRIPVELAQFKELIQKMIDHEVEINPELEKFYAYITVDQHFVTKGNTHRRGGIHIDGVQGARYPVKLRPEHTYSASDAFGTVFYNQSYDLRKLDPAKQHVHAEIERQTRAENAVVADDYGLFFWDSYSPHESNVATSDRMRTFLRIEFSEKIYDGVGDTVSPLFDYNWQRIDRAIPVDLDDRPVAPVSP